MTRIVETTRCCLVLLGLATTAIVGFGGDVAPGQSAAGRFAGLPSFMAIDLHPSGFIMSVAYGTSSGQQVGFGTAAGAPVAHAPLWHSSANSVVDLNPTSGFDSSQALGISVGEQVGFGSSGHALLWRGSASSMVDLNPPGFVDSWASGTSDRQQVGFWKCSVASWGACRTCAAMARYGSERSGSQPTRFCVWSIWHLQLAAGGVGSGSGQPGSPRTLVARQRK